MWSYFYQCTQKMISCLNYSWDTCTHTPWHKHSDLLILVIESKSLDTPEAECLLACRALSHANSNLSSILSVFCSTILRTIMYVCFTLLRSPAADSILGCKSVFFVSSSPSQTEWSLTAHWITDDSLVSKFSHRKHREEEALPLICAKASLDEFP